MNDNISASNGLIHCIIIDGEAFLRVGDLDVERVFCVFFAIGDTQYELVTVNAINLADSLEDSARALTDDEEIVLRAVKAKVAIRVLELKLALWNMTTFLLVLGVKAKIGLAGSMVLIESPCRRIDPSTARHKPPIRVIHDNTGRA